MPDRPGDMDERDVDARFASIVARWDGPVPDADHPPADDEPEAPGAEPVPTDLGHGGRRPGRRHHRGGCR